MGRIHVLEAHVVNQIAAGEVIERPASVVKELVENALDAGARRVDVRVEEGGTAVVEVADDGCGMEADDLAAAFLPHATSKVDDVEDLVHIASLGFRGEALASLGSVARVTIVSRTADAAGAWLVENREGVIGDVEPAAGAPGTVVRAEGLFHHVPARRKFLRSAPTELGHVRTLVGNFALAWPDVAFRLRLGPRTLLDLPPCGDRRARIAALHGDDVASALLRVEAATGDLALEGWVGPPSLHRADGRLEQTFLNGRHVRDKTIAHALRVAYDGLLPPGGRRPVAFLFLSCDPGRVDVNVHPAKAEVRWRETNPVHALVRTAIRRTLEGAEPGVDVALDSRSAVPAHTREAVEFAFTHPPAVPAGSAARGAMAADRPSPGPPVGVDPGPPPPDTAARSGRGLRPVGQALGTYLVLEGADEIVLVDQHALHERVLYERISERLREKGALEVQRLLVPAVVQLDPPQVQTLAEAEEIVANLGWHVEPFGDDAVAIHGMPALLKRPDPEATLRALLDALERGVHEGFDRARLLDDAVDRLACRAAVMAGDRLHADEVLALLEQAESLAHAHSCPHGRPTRLTLPRAKLERWFHRQV